ERGLVDGVVATADRGLGERGLPPQALAAVGRRVLGLDARDPPAGGLEGGEEAGLVAQPALLDHVQLGIAADRPLDQAGGGGDLEAGQVLAGEEADEVRGREDRTAVEDLHGSRTPGPIRMPRRAAGSGPEQGGADQPTRSRTGGGRKG